MCVLFYILCVTCVQVFANYSFYEIVAFNSHERDLLLKIQLTNDKIYFLNGITNEAATLMNVVVDSCCTFDFEQKLLKYDIEYSHANESLYLSNNNEFLSSKEKSVLQKFLDWDNILKWIERKSKQNSALTKTVIAKTYEHRDIFVLKVSGGRTAKKMAVFVIAGEEGRDWLSSAILLNYINQLLEAPNSPQSLLHYYDMYFIPIFNPDGFVYSKKMDRMWAKNRKIIEPTLTHGKCNGAVGVNIDRNWFIHSSDSTHPCDTIYSGSKALSEEETQGLSYIVNSIALKLMAFINLRGFGNLITLPYAHNNEEAINHNIMMEIMKHTSAVLNLQYKKSYPVGTTSSYYYNYTGNMPDWVKKKLNTPVVFTVYMQQEKFLPIESHIQPVTDQFGSLLNISLIISKEIYQSLYNTKEKNASIYVLIIICFICVF